MHGWTFQYVSTGILLCILLKVSSVFSVSMNVGGRSTAKNYCPINLLSVVSKIYETNLCRPVNMLDDLLKKFGFFVISSMVLGLLIQLKTFESFI